MLWRLIIRDFGPNIQYVAGFDNIVSDTLSIFPATQSNKYKSCTSKAQCCADEIFEPGRVENNEDCLPLNLSIVQREQQKELRNINSKLGTYISGRGSSYFKQDIDEVEIICYDSKIYVPQLCADVC